MPIRFDRRPRKLGLVVVGLCAVSIALAVQANGLDARASGAACLVPSAQYPTVQSAVDDLACDTALLSAGDYLGATTVGRDFVISGPPDFSARLLGGLTVEGDSSTAVSLQYVTLENDPEAANGIFADGFETGDTSRWQ